MDDTEQLLSSQRNQLRRRLRRATTAVAIILLSVLALAVAAVIAGRRAAQDQRRAEDAEAAGRERLWRAHFAEARAARLSDGIGRRGQALLAVSNAAVLRDSAELRIEAIAAHALPDFEEETTPGIVATNKTLIDFAPGLELYVVNSNSVFRIHRTKDQSVLFQLDPQAAGLKPAPARDRRVNGLQFSPDSRYFSVSFRDGAFVVWELSGGRPVAVHAPRSAAPSHSEFSRDGSHFAYQDADRTNALAVIELASGHRVDHFVTPRGGQFAMRPGIGEVAIASNKVVRLVSLDSDAVKQEIVAPSAITWLLWSPEGRRLAAISDVHDLYLWDTDSGRLQILARHKDLLRTLTFSPDGGLLLSSSNDDVTYLWDTATGRPIVGARDRIGFEFSQDGRQVAFLVDHQRVVTCRFGDDGVFRTLVARGGRDQRIDRFDLSTDGRWFAMAVEGGVQVWDLTEPKSEAFFPMPDVTSLAWHPDGPTLALCQAGKLAFHPIESAAGRIRLGPARAVPLPPRVSLHQAGFSLDGRFLCAELNDRRMMVLDLTGQRTNVFFKIRSDYRFYARPASGSGTGRFTISPDGRWLVNGYGSADHTMPEVFDAQTGRLHTTLATSPGMTTFSPDGQWLITCGGDTYSLWQVRNWSLLWRRKCEPLGGLRGNAAFTRDGRRLALTLDRHQVGLVDAATGDTLAEFVPPELESIGGVRLAHDGSRLVTTTYNGLAQAWDLARVRSRVASLALDWEMPVRHVANVPQSAQTRASSDVIWLALMGAGLATIFAVVTLMRQRRITEEFVQAETTALRRGRELQVQREVNQLKSSFISMVSHEFRTPLGVIRSSGEILQTYFDKLKPEQRREHLDDIVRSSIRMKDLMEEVLLLGRVEAGRMECRLAPVNLPHLIRGAVTEISTATGERRPIRVEFAGINGDCRLDESVVHIILINLLSNAVKYSPPGSPIQCLARRDGDCVQIDIRDEGIGIPVTDQVNLFKTFHRATNVGDISGTGLGLTIVKRCVELHRGTISFVTAEGIGTTFTVRFPA